MKTSALLTSLLLAVSASAVPQFGRNRGGNNNGGNNNANNGNTGNNANNGGNNAANNTANNAATGTAANSTANNAANNGGNNGGDPQTSLTLDPAVIASGFANNGQDQPTAGQVASLTSTNNFINFCLTVPNLPITNGKQIQTGSCNPAPIGTIPSVDNMPSSKFVSPANGDTIAANSAFTISMAIKNMITGNFVNAQENYFAAPQQLSNGQIVGHTHVVVETLSDLAQTTPTNPKQFAFFKGVNGAAVNGVVTADVTDGLPAGAYRLCSINAAANHQPVIVPIAQHGSLDDCVYFTASANGGNNAGAAAASNNATAAAAATATATTASNNNGQNKGQQAQNKGQNNQGGGRFGGRFGRNRL